MPKTKAFDMEAYIKRISSGPCFICQIAAGHPDYSHHMIYEDDETLVFLNKYPVLPSYALVAPRSHREQVTADFSPDEYLRLQALIYRVTEAVRQVTAAERMYLLSLGSQQGNSHVHWHVVSLPPGIPFRQQQLEALRVADRVLDQSPEELAAQAREIRAAMDEIAGQAGES